MDIYLVHTVSQLLRHSIEMLQGISHLKFFIFYFPITMYLLLPLFFLNGDFYGVFSFLNESLATHE